MCAFKIVSPRSFNSIMLWQMKKFKLTLAMRGSYHNMERKGQPFHRGFNQRVMVIPQ